MGIWCVKFKAVLHIRANVNHGEIRGSAALRGDWIKVGVVALFAPRGCSFHPFFIKRDPGGREGKGGHGEKGDGVKGKLSWKWIARSMAFIGFKSILKKFKTTLKLYLNGFGVGFLVRILEGFLSHLDHFG